MKVMGQIPGAHCTGCGSVLRNLDWPDRTTGDFTVACGMPGCANHGIAVRLTAPIIDAPLVYPEWQ